MKELSLRQQILKKLSQLKERREPWLDHWQDIADYVIPERDNIRADKERGRRIGTKIYDSTATSALDLFVDGLHGYLISPSIQWFKLMILGEVGELPEVKQYLQEVEEQMYYAYQRSNFYESMHMYLADGGALGTAAMHIEEDLTKGLPVFTCIHPGEICIAENIYGAVDTLFREFKYTAKQAAERWGTKKLSPTLRGALTKNPYQEFEFIHAVFPREDRDVTKEDGVNKPWASIWLEKNAQDNQDSVLSIGGYDEFPDAVWRYRKTGKEVYGRSPASRALSDIIGLQLISKDMLKASQMAVDPPLNVPGDLKGQVNWMPRGYNYYAKPDMVVSPIHPRIDYPVGIDREERKQKAIEQHFHVDFFLMLARADKQLTATEVIELQGEKAAILGAAVGRFNTEALSKIIDRTFNIEHEAGRLPEPPAVLLEQAGGNIDVIYMGPLAQAQRRLFRTQGIMKGLEMVMPLIQLKPELMDHIDMDVTFKEILESAGFPQKAIRAKDLVEKLREMRAQVQEEESQAEDAQTLVQGVKTLAEADKASGGKISAAMGAQ